MRLKIVIATTALIVSPLVTVAEETDPVIEERRAWLAGVEKLATAFGVAMIGMFLGTMGYVQSTDNVQVEQPESAITAIRYSIALVPLTVEVICLALLTQYTLSKDKLEQLKKETLAANKDV